MELQNINLEGGEERERGRASLRTPLRHPTTSIVNRVGTIKVFPCFPKEAWLQKLLLISALSIGTLLIVATVSGIHCAGNGTCYEKCREKYYSQMVCGGRSLKDQGSLLPYFGECSCDCFCLIINKTVDKLDCTPDACMIEGEVDEIPGRI